MAFININSKIKDSYKRLPGPITAPYVGVALQFQKQGVDYLYRHHLKYGDFSRFPIPGIRGVLVTDPEFIKMALAQTERQFYKGRIYDLAKVVVGDGIVTSKGAKWKKNRHHINPIFSPKNLSTFDPTIHETINNAIHKLESSGSGTTNLSEFSSSMTFAIIAKTMFSVTNEQEFSSLAKNFKVCLDFLSWYFWAPFPLPLSVPTKRNQLFLKAKNQIVDYISELIESRQITSKKDDLLQRLIDAESGEMKTKLSRDEIIDETLTAMLAGYETTALTISYAFFLLSQNKNWIEIIRDEINNVFQNERISSDRIFELPKTLAVIKETMRLYPSAYMINRSNKELINYKKYSFKADTTFFFPQFAVHRHEKHWEQPLSFNPERFLDNTSNNSAYFPFGGGPRSCVGNHLALIEATLCLGEIVRKFDLQYLEQNFILMPSATMIPKPDLKVQFVKPNI